MTSDSKRKHRAKVDEVRKNAGLPVYDKPLIRAACRTCRRIFHWREELMPNRCQWPGCAGELERCE